MEGRTQPLALGLGIFAAALGLTAAAVGARTFGRKNRHRLRPGAIGTSRRRPGGNLCASCNGDGTLARAWCEVCGDTGMVVVNVGDA